MSEKAKKSVSSRAEAVVIGGGVSGLACAHALKRAGLDVVLCEAKPEAGGNIRTVREGDFTYESGPHTFMGSADEIFDLLAQLGLQKTLTPANDSAKARFIVRDQKAHRVPSGPLSFLKTGLLSAGGKLALMAEPFRRGQGSDEDTAADFFARRFGPEAGHVLAGAFINGVYAGDPAALSAPAAFPLFWGFEKERGSMIRGAMARKKSRKAQGLPLRKGLFTFAGGLGELTDALARSLGPACRVGAPAQALRKTARGYEVFLPGETIEAPRVILAVPPAAASALTAQVSSDISASLAAIPMAKVAVVHLGFERRVEEIPNGYGYLSSPGAGCRTLGVLFPSRLFGGRAPGDLFTAYLGGVGEPGVLERSDEELASRALADLDMLFHARSSPSFVKVLRHRRAIPQLVMGHLERRAAIERSLSDLGGLHVAGNYMRGVGVKDAVASGLAAARAALRDAKGAS